MHHSPSSLCQAGDGSHSLCTVGKHSANPATYPHINDFLRWNFQGDYVDKSVPEIDLNSFSPVFIAVTFGRILPWVVSVHVRPPRVSLACV